MLKENNYVCLQCIKKSIDELEVKVVALSDGLTVEEMKLIRSLYRND